MLVARDPDTGVETEGYHRFQVKGRNRMGVSLHSRRRMFEYQRRAEAKGQALPCAVVLGLHPLVSMGSLAYPPADVGKFEVVGGLFGEPLQVAPCSTIDLHVPAAAEIVIEGEILPGEREPEGPFGEFTGYFSRRSTEHVFVARAIAMRERPWFQSIGSGRAGDHITTLGLVREAEILNALGRVIPNVKAVHVPLSGASSFTAFVSIKQTRPGEAKHVIPIVLGVDHYLKLVVVVDDDVDVFDESDVLWAVATRMQADRDLVVDLGQPGRDARPERRRPRHHRQARHRRDPPVRRALRREARDAARSAWPGPVPSRRSCLRQEDDLAVALTRRDRDEGVGGVGQREAAVDHRAHLVPRVQGEEGVHPLIDERGAIVEVASPVHADHAEVLEQHAIGSRMIRVAAGAR